MPELIINMIKKLSRIFSLRFIMIVLTGLWCGYLPARDNSVESNDSTAHELEEVTVEAKKEIHTAEADIIILSDKNREFGTNALDAISSLRQFSPMLDGTELKTVAQKDVFILINGRPSSARELRGYTGKEIKKVTFYPMAPARYSSFTDGPLIDVAIKIDKDYIHTFLSASNSINVGYGTDQAVVRWADSLNMVRADYFIDYRNLTYDNRDIYSYPGTPELDRSYRTASRYTGNFQQGNVSWQNTAHDNLVHLSAGITHNPANRKYTGIPDNLERAGTENEEYSRSLRNMTDMGNLNFYFSRQSHGRWLEIQATGSVGKTTSVNYLGNERNDDGTSSSNRSYTGYGKVMYYTPGKVNLFLTGSYQYQHADHRQILPASIRYASDDDCLDLSADLTGQFSRENKKLAYSLGISLIRDHIRVRHFGVDRKDWRLKPYLTLSVTLSEKFFMRFRGSMSSGMPSVGMLSEVPTYQESNLAWSGNPDLNGWKTYRVRWQPQYKTQSGKFSINGDFSYRYVSSPVRSCITGGNPVQIRYMNLDSEREAEGSLIVNIIPLKNFTLNSYLEWTHWAYRTPSRNVDRGYFRYGGSIMYNTPRVQAAAHVNAPYKIFRGDITEYGGWQFSCSVLVKLPAGFSATLRWNHSYQGDRTTIFAPGILEYTGFTRIPHMANQITLGLTWSFSHGLFRNRHEASLEKIDPDSGISDFNKAKM